MWLVVYLTEYGVFYIFNDSLLNLLAWNWRREAIKWCDFAFLLGTGTSISFHNESSFYHRLRPTELRSCPESADARNMSHVFSYLDETNCTL